MAVVTGSRGNDYAPCLCNPSSSDRGQTTPAKPRAASKFRLLVDSGLAGLPEGPPRERTDREAKESSGTKEAPKKRCEFSIHRRVETHRLEAVSFQRVSQAE